MSHHNSGPRAHQLPEADITDMYAFTVPGAQGRLGLVLNLVPWTPPNGRFSDALIYRFRIRPITVDASEPALFSAADPAAEITIDCTFTTPDVAQTGTCTVSVGGNPTGTSVTFAVDDEAGGATDGLRAFGGPRWDPFFSDATALVNTISTGKLSFTDHGSILGDGKNVMSIVVEVDLEPLVGDGSIVAVVGESVIGGKIPVRWERFGRPEFENAILGMKNYDTVNRDLEIRDLFNAEDAFALGPDYLGAYHARLNANLAYWDGLDDNVDWPVDADGNHPLAEMLLADFMIVDAWKPFGDNTFLEIERAARDGRPHETMGGRSLNDDCMDTLYTYLVNAAKGPRISDHVDAPTRLASDTFPYLAPANPNPPEAPGSH